MSVTQSQYDALCILSNCDGLSATESFLLSKGVSKQTLSSLVQRNYLCVQRDRYSGTQLFRSFCTHFALVTEHYQVSGEKKPSDLTIANRAVTHAEAKLMRNQSSGK